MKKAVAILISISAVFLAPAQAQQYVISTYAGVPKQPDPIFVQGVAADAAGNVYFTSTQYCVCIFKLDRNGAVTRIAGNSEAGYSGDGGPSASAQLNRPMGMAVDGAGNLFFADRFNHRIRRISPDGMIATVAGNGERGYSGDGGPAIDAQLGFAGSVAVDGAGNLFISDNWPDGIRQVSRIRKVSPDGVITTLAIDGYLGAVDGGGNLFIVENYSRIRKVSPDGTITTVAGAGPSNNPDCNAGHSGDGGPATQAPLCSVSSVAVDRAGNLFFIEFGYSSRYAEPTNIAVRQVSPDGVITTVAGAGTQLYWGLDVAVDGAGSLFIAEGSSVRKISSDGIITTVAGDSACCYSGDGGPATSAQLNGPHDVGVDSAGNLFIADGGNHRIRRVTPDGIITTVAGGTVSVRCLDLSGVSGPATAAQLCESSNIAVDGGGNVFIAAYNRVRKVSPDGTIAAVAGNGTPGYSGDGGPAIEAQVNARGVAVDGAGNLFIADYYRIRKVSPDGIITTIAGNGAYGYSGDGGPAINASIVAGYASVTVDGAGNLFFVDGARIRRVSSGGIITTVAGNGTTGYSGDGGPAIKAQVYPVGVAVDGAGNLFIADIGNRRIRRVSPDGIISTIAGNGERGFAGDGGAAIDAQLWSPNSVAVDDTGNLYVSDYNDVVRILRPVK
jgi:hypothetical protein